METKFGDPSKPDTGLLGKLVTASRRVMTGESMFVTTFTQTGIGKGQVAFASPYPGKNPGIRSGSARRRTDLSERVLLSVPQRGTQMAIAFQRKIGVGLFGAKAS